MTLLIGHQTKTLTCTDLPYGRAADLASEAFSALYHARDAMMVVTLNNDAIQGQQADKKEVLAHELLILAQALTTQAKPTRAVEDIKQRFVDERLINDDKAVDLITVREKSWKQTWNTIKSGEIVQATADFTAGLFHKPFC